MKKTRVGSQGAFRNAVRGAVFLLGLSGFVGCASAPEATPSPSATPEPSPGPSFTPTPVPRPESDPAEIEAKASRQKALETRQSAVDAKAPIATKELFERSEALFREGETKLSAGNFPEAGAGFSLAADSWEASRRAALDKRAKALEALEASRAQKSESETRALEAQREFEPESEGTEAPGQGPGLSAAGPESSQGPDTAKAESQEIPTPTPGPEPAQTGSAPSATPEPEPSPGPTPQTTPVQGGSL